MSKTQFVKAHRISTSFLAEAETRCLRWMAARLPPQINSDHLTALALGAMLMIGVSYWIAREHPLALVAVNAWLVVNWFGDSLDGTVARVRGHERPRYGFYVDHIVDAFGTLLLVGGLGLSGYMSPIVALLLLVAYFLLSIDVYLATYCVGQFRLSYWKFGPTELRLLLCAGNLVLLVHPHAVLFGRQYLLFDVGGVVAAVLLLVTAVVSAIRNTRTLYSAEPLPDAKSRSTSCAALRQGC
ncbi:MAG TPA: CDP-alcohol phosphatidyltransferase family protein [Vicinamibacterales bacterium]